MSSSLPLMTSCSGYSVDVCIFRKNGSASNELRDLEVLQPAGRERSLTNLYFQQEERRPGTTLPVKCQPQGTEARPGFQWISRCESAVNIDYYKEENCLWDLVLILDLFLSCTWTDLGVKFLWTDETKNYKQPCCPCTKISSHWPGGSQALRLLL